MYFCSNYLCEIWIWYLTVFIIVYRVVNFFKFSIRQFEAPMIHIEFQFLLWDVACFTRIFVYVRESFTYGFPLNNYFAYYFIYDISFTEICFDLIFNYSVFSLFISFKWYISNRIMSKIEALTHMNWVANPRWKVFIRELAFISRVFTFGFNQFS